MVRVAAALYNRQITRNRIDPIGASEPFETISAVVDGDTVGRPHQTSGTVDPNVCRSRRQARTSTIEWPARHGMVSGVLAQALLLFLFSRLAQFI